MIILLQLGGLPTPWF